MRRPRLWRVLFAASLASSLVTSFAGGLARADEIDSLGGKVVEINAKIRELDNRIVPQRGPQADLADRRLIDAQVLYELKNYEAASLILLDVVEKYPNTRAWPEAVFFLADSLFLKRDFLSSRRYFQKVVEIGPEGRRYVEGLQRLIELSLYTGDYTPVDGYLAQLASLPPGQQRPSVPYVKGKYYYFRQKYDQAEEAFKDIKVGHVYWFHSQYFVGAGQVARGKTAEAILTYEGILRTEAKTDSQKRIAELSHLALGRIYYDRGQLTNALNEYGKISLKSELQGDSLYEQAWVNIKAKDYKKAYRALDTLLTLKPDDPIAPEVKLLIGNLHIRQNEYKEATDSFTKTRDEFEPIRKQMEALRPADSMAYFKDLIGKNLGKFDTTTYLPPLAVKWVKAEPEMNRVVNLVTDVSDLKKSLDESQEIVNRLEKALSGPQRINVFPELATARANVVELRSQLGEVQRQLVNAERAIIAPVASPSERAQLDRLEQERKKIESQLSSVPSDVDSLEARKKRLRDQFDDLDRQATLLNALLAQYSAERVAIEVYYKNSRKEQKGDPERAARELAEARTVEEELRKQYDRLRHDIADSAQTVGVDDVDMQAEARLRKQHTDLLAQEHDLGDSLRARLGGAARTKADQIASILDRARAAERSLTAFNQKVYDNVEERLKDVRVSLAEEKAHVAEYQKVLGGYEGETVDVGAGVTAENFRTIADRFYQIVVRSDVGIIDVAWALKQSKTDENQRLAHERKRELKLIDDDFKEALRE